MKFAPLYNLTAADHAAAFSRGIFSFCRRHAVLMAALAAALVTCAFVPIDAGYLAYFDLRTLSCLFATLAVVCCFKNMHFFVILAEKIVTLFKTARGAVLALVGVTYFGSMLLANDMALITFLPLGYLVLNAAGKRKYLAFTFVMQNIAANLGGMITPFGNPQNLYLYSRFELDAAGFFRIMAPPFFAAALLIALVCCFVPRERIALTHSAGVKLSLWRTACYTALFVVSVLIVFRVFPFAYGLVAVFAGVLILDYRALKRVDYPLLLTFCAFFVFSGNLARIPAVHTFFSGLIAADTLSVTVLCCQFISNVPTAVLLSNFTGNVAPLLVGVNIGGLGTPLASLASLITLNEFRLLEPTGSGRYLALFLLLNFAFLFVLSGVAVLWGAFS